MRRTILALMILSVLVISMSNISNSKADGDRGVKLKVTVTNLTAGQIESPVVVATHNRELDPLFELGSPASDALAALAEDAINGPLIEALETDPNVKRTCRSSSVKSAPSCRENRPLWLCGRAENSTESHSLACL